MMKAPKKATRITGKSYPRPADQTSRQNELGIPSGHEDLIHEREEREHHGEEDEGCEEHPVLANEEQSGGPDLQAHEEYEGYEDGRGTAYREAGVYHRPGVLSRGGKEPHQAYVEPEPREHSQEGYDGDYGYSEAHLVGSVIPCNDHPEEEAYTACRDRVRHQEDGIPVERRPQIAEKLCHEAHEPSFLLPRYVQRASQVRVSPL